MIALIFSRSIAPCPRFTQATPVHCYGMTFLLCLFFLLPIVSAVENVTIIFCNGAQGCGTDSGLLVNCGAINATDGIVFLKAFEFEDSFFVTEKFVIPSTSLRLTVDPDDSPIDLPSPSPSALVSATPSSSPPPSPSPSPSASQQASGAMLDLYSPDRFLKDDTGRMLSCSKIFPEVFRIGRYFPKRDDIGMDCRAASRISDIRRCGDRTSKVCHRSQGEASRLLSFIQNLFF